MWIHTKDGFFSVTTNTRDESEQTLMVRGRRRHDLERMLDRVKSIQPPFYHNGMLPEIIETPKADYRFRVILNRTLWAEYLVTMTDDLDYTNVKGTLAKGDKELSRAMMACWDALADLQVGGPYGRGRFGYGDGRSEYIMGLTSYDELDLQWELESFSDEEDTAQDTAEFFPYDLLRHPL